MHFSSLNKKDLPCESDSIQIKDNRIKGFLNAVVYTDADTGQIVYHFPALDISGYGENEEKAKKMAKFSIDQFLNHLIKLSSKDLESELCELGWEHGKSETKEYSKTSIDVNGSLYDLNTLEGRFECLILETA